jgi:membrane protein YqaA with SNARE-associated domain
MNADRYPPSVWLVALSWALGSPLGWLVGWLIGSSLARYVFRTSSALNQEIIAFKWGPLGGLIGLMLAWTISALLLSHTTKKVWETSSLLVERKHFWLLAIGWILPASCFCMLCSLSVFL